MKRRELITRMLQGEKLVSVDGGFAFASKGVGSAFISSRFTSALVEDGLIVMTINGELSADVARCNEWMVKRGMAFRA